MKQLRNRKLNRDLLRASRAGKLRDFSRSEVAGLVANMNKVKPMNFAGFESSPFNSSPYNGTRLNPFGAPDFHPKDADKDKTSKDKDKDKDKTNPTLRDQWKTAGASGAAFRKDLANVGKSAVKKAAKPVGGLAMLGTSGVIGGAIGHSIGQNNSEGEAAPETEVTPEWMKMLNETNANVQALMDKQGGYDPYGAPTQNYASNTVAAPVGKPEVANTNTAETEVPDTNTANALDPKTAIAAQEAKILGSSKEMNELYKQLGLVRTSGAGAQELYKQNGGQLTFDQYVAENDINGDGIFDQVGNQSAISLAKDEERKYLNSLARAKDGSYINTEDELKDFQNHLIKNDPRTADLYDQQLTKDEFLAQLEREKAMNIQRGLSPDAVRWEYNKGLNNWVDNDGDGLHDLTESETGWDKNFNDDIDDVANDIAASHLDYLDDSWF